jgi:large subunit ribosomal protein L13
MMKTMIPTEAQAQRAWYVVDADGKVLGRLATRIATILRGKHKALFTPHMDTGDFVIVVNAKAVRLTGRKREQKKAYRHSGYPGGLRETSYATLLARHPERVITEAVKGMLPKTRQGRQLLKKLKVYAGPTHEHQAQKPAPLSV